eukprot:10740527-Alexandrium_andersonii.AAC.1
MSASLVGSEMCIRDRQQPLEDASGAVRRCPAPFGALQRFYFAEQRLKPVSYTHLTLPTICSV